MTTEHERLAEASRPDRPWRKWGPYLSERQWGTVREDYSEGGNAWEYFTHDQARSRAYRWGEDGLAGLSDDRQRLCFALALWNGKDPILKERLFGLTNGESNHGEDVKEYYFYLDSTPTHSYMKYLYKYPQAAFPYADLVETSRRRSRQDFEYELLDTGVFDGDHYFDVFVEYAKNSPEDVLIQISVYNRGPEAAGLHVLPTLWFRNLWSWDGSPEHPRLQQVGRPSGVRVVKAVDARLGERHLYCDGEPTGVAGRRLASILDETKLHRVLAKMLDENEFLSTYGIRSLSRYHAEHPYVLQAGGQEYRVSYLPAESDTAMFGGNSNWRGPIWMPVNVLIVRALLQYYSYYGDLFTVECPTGSGRYLNLYQVAEEIARRLAAIFVKDKDSRPPVYGGTRKFQEDPHWQDLILFYEYFHGDNGAGLGASHQTGWTGVVARGLHLFATTTAGQVLQLGKTAAAVELQKSQGDEQARSVAEVGSGTS
jgi:hypothetical protein